MWWIRRLICCFVILDIFNTISGQYKRTLSLFLILTVPNQLASDAPLSSTASTAGENRNTSSTRSSTIDGRTTSTARKDTTARKPFAGVTSVHKPKLSSCVSWNSSGMTIENGISVGSNIFNAFVGINDTLYVTDRSKKILRIMPTKAGLPAKRITTNLTLSTGLFVTNTGDIYLDQGNNSYIIKWSVNTGFNKIIMYINRGCDSLFVSIDYILYCSINNGHQVIKMSLNTNVSLLTTAAGTGCAGSTSIMLDQPSGIYVDVSLDLYVADTGNDRIQLFRYGELNATTIAGKRGTFIYTLNRPTSVILDADDYLFIVDSGSQRIIRLGPGVFECIIGCSMQSCSQPNQLCGPLTAMFDSLGNIYVINQNISGIQKYILATNSCVSSTTQTTVPSTTISIINQTCFPPIITLFPGQSYFENPLQFRRSQDFYITAILQLTCADSLVIETKWSIFNCTLNCSIPANIDQSINTSFSELFIPAKTLIYGLYEFKLTVTMVDVPKMTKSESAFIKINPSGITANLVQFGTSIVTSGQERELTLNPGYYSINPDENTFNASDWTYEYQCRIYDSTNITRWAPINESNHPCFSNRKSINCDQSIGIISFCLDNGPAWRYDLVNASQSSVTILNGSLKYNHTYQFVVFMRNRRNSTSQATGYVIVNVDNSLPQMVAVACVISTMCSANQEYQYINPNTQVALFSDCVQTCHPVSKIHWYIYQGLNDSSTNIVKWTRFTQNLHFYGMNTSNFTALNTLFLDNKHIVYWRFEVVYTFLTANSSSALNFIINQPPENGTCLIDPPNGTTSTLFTINCTEWIDEDGLKDYSFYRRITPTEQVMLAFTILPTLRIQLPSGNDNTSILSLTVQIRDVLNCVKEHHMEPVIVIPDQTAIDTLIDILKNPNNGSTSNAIVQALASGNQNTVGQVVTSLSQEFNKRNKQSLEMAVANGTPAASISVSPLGSKSNSEPSGSKNGLISPEYVQKLTNLANIRDYLMKATTNLPITNIDSIKLQANTLAQLTEATNELTRSASMLASTRCHQLAVKLKGIAMRISYEDAQFASTHIALCMNHVLTAINAPLQQRGVLLNITSVDEDIDNVDSDSDPELFQLTLQSLANGDDISSKAAKKDRIFYYQKKAANQIAEQATATLSLITSILDVHLNIGQNLTMNSPSLLISLETTSIESLSNKSIKQIGNAQIRIPLKFQSNLTKNTSISLRSAMQALAPFGASQSQANTNMSTTISLTVLDRYGNEIPIQATDDQPIEFFIPRDPNLILPDMILQNVTSSEELFNLSLNQFLINKNLTVSLHFELRPLNISLGYLFLYKFDKTPQLNRAKNNIDDWDLFCPLNLSNKNIYTYYINNRKTAGHQSVVFKLRELNSTEVKEFCPRKLSDSPPIFNEPGNFTSNYELRIYSSGCYYLDRYNNWQSDGLWVGPLTNHYQTQCFSTHLTTFTSSFLVLPFPTDEKKIHYQNEVDLRINWTQFNQLEWINKYNFTIHSETNFRSINQRWNKNVFQPSYLCQNID